MTSLALLLLMYVDDQTPDLNKDLPATDSIMEEAEDLVESYSESFFFQAATFTEGVTYGFDGRSYRTDFGTESSQRFAIGRDLAADSDDSSFISTVFEFGSNSLSARGNYVTYSEEAVVPRTRMTRSVNSDTFGYLTNVRLAKPGKSAISVVGGWGWIWVRDRLSLDEELVPGEGTEFSSKWNEFMLKYGLKYEAVCTENFSLFLEYRREVLPFGDIDWDSDGILLGFKLEL